MSANAVPVDTDKGRQWSAQSLASLQRVFSGGGGGGLNYRRGRGRKSSCSRQRTWEIVANGTEVIETVKGMVSTE